MNHNMSEDLKKVNAPATPDMGARVPAGKDNRGDVDTLSAKHTKESVRQAVAVPGSAMKAIKLQAGKAMDNMTQENSGCCDCE